MSSLIMRKRKRKGAPNDKTRFTENWIDNHKGKTGDYGKKIFRIVYNENGTGT